MSKLSFKTPGASNPSSHTRTVSTDHNFPKSFIKLVAGTAIIFTVGKRKEDFTTGKRNISRSFRNVITLLLLLITLKQLVTASNGTILTFCRPAKLTTIVRLRRPCLFRSCRQHWMSMSVVKSNDILRRVALGTRMRSSPLISDQKRKRSQSKPPSPSKKKLMARPLVGEGRSKTFTPLIFVGFSSLDGFHIPLIFCLNSLTSTPFPGFLGTQPGNQPMIVFLGNMLMQTWQSLTAGEDY